MILMLYVLTYVLLKLLFLIVIEHKNISTYIYIYSVVYLRAVALLAWNLGYMILMLLCSSHWFMPLNSMTYG